jgi:hypothetical protein
MTRPEETVDAAPPFDFVRLASDVEGQYRSYLRTTFHLRDPILRASFDTALDAYSLTNGPFVEAIPSFVKAPSATDVLSDLLGAPMEPALGAALGGRRPLYAHQQQAIRAIDAGRNVVVATGTGSGKTEAFLYPILLHLYREHLRGGRRTGVRALILYPMNALANDQRDRLRELDCALRAGKADFTFSFGQYTGETPEDARDSRRNAAEKEREASPGELVFRAQMRDAPPDILLTNYSMLEYLLTRPADNPLFGEGNARDWAFIVLDEAHQYRGANGIEMALLVRRLRDRLREGGCDNDIRCIATSATLGRGDKDRADVAAFAESLFGRPFLSADIILPQTQSPAFDPDRTLNPEAYAELEITYRAGKLAAHELGAQLLRDTRAVDLVQSVVGAPRPLPELAASTFPELKPTEADEAASALIRLLTAAEDDTGERLLQARIHLFLRSLEGAFLRFDPAPEITLNHDALRGAAFELALCRECGQHYLAGRRSHGHLVEARRDPGDPDFGVTFYLPLDDGTTYDGDDDEATDADTRPHALCVRCGAIAGHPTSLDHDPDCIDPAVIALQEVTAAAQLDRARTCLACGYSGRDPIGEVVHGTDGPHAVVATSLFREMDQAHRKVLAFADGRQQAAFFAWYLQDSYSDLLARNLMLRAIHEVADHVGDPSFSDIAQGLAKELTSAGVLSQAMGNAQRLGTAWRHVYREVLSDQRRISLEGLGLVAWGIQWPPSLLPPKVLIDPPWSLSSRDAFDILHGLFETLRQRRAMTLTTQPGVALDFAGLDLLATQLSTRIGAPDGNKGVFAWDGPRTHRVDLLRRMFQHRYGGEPAQDFVLQCLRSIWAHLVDFDEDQPDDERVFVETNQHTHRLNPSWWRASIPTVLYRCTVCGRLQGAAFGGVCLRYRCTGVVVEVSPATIDDNHYRSLAKDPLPGRMRVEEHTAQLSNEKAREFQRDFKRGMIDVLSCSTTFELGVDLGDLDAVFLRNVPPESFNYQQRVGRAARRAGRPGFAVTYCSRSPHDLFHFNDPARIVRGESTPPFLRLGNERIATRHIASVVLSRFLRENAERFGNVRALLGEMSEPDVVERVRAFATDQRVSISAALSRILPPALHARYELEAANPRWIDDVAGSESSLARAVVEVSSDYRSVSEYEQASAAARKYNEARWAELRKRTIENVDVLGFLSRKAVIPKYGFPADVVSLDTSLSSDREGVELDRDLALAISEFAPGASLIANKKEWKSYAVKRVPDREWDRAQYAVCRDHGVFERWREHDGHPTTAPCCAKLRDGVQEFIRPEFGFTTRRGDPPGSPRSRPRKEHSTRPYIVASSATSPVAVELPAAMPAVRVYQPTQHEMAVLCEGKYGHGFLICPLCGAGAHQPSKSKRNAAHKTPFGAPCPGKPTRVSLAHTFSTDIIRMQFLRPLPPNVASPHGFGWSLGYALVEGAAAATGAPSTDLAVTITYDPLYAVPPLILYDSVPGGAGLVATLEHTPRLRDAIDAAIVRVAGSCGCGDLDSCYGCLRSYRNQFMHDQLQRGPVLHYLEAILKDLGGHAT